MVLFRVWIFSYEINVGIHAFNKKQIRSQCLVDTKAAQKLHGFALCSIPRAPGPLASWCSSEKCHVCFTAFTRPGSLYLPNHPISCPCLSTDLPCFLHSTRDFLKLYNLLFTHLLSVSSDSRSATSGSLLCSQCVTVPSTQVYKGPGTWYINECIFL